MSLKEEKGATINNDFLKILHDTDCKPNKIWVDKGGELYNRSMKSFLQDNVFNA